MSSPLSSLRKSHKTPLLPGNGQRPVPFRNPEYSDDESRLLDEITTGMTTNRIRGRDPFGGGLPRIESNAKTYMSTSPGRESGHPGAAPSDRELLSLMMSRVAQLESKVQYQSKEMADKDKKIRVLEDKLKIVQRVQGDNTNMSSDHTRSLEKKCLLLQQQVHEMETFLSDYGMVWIGEKTNPKSDVYHDNASSGGSEDELWRPGSSLSRAPEIDVDYDRLNENIRDLNVLAGEGVAKIQHTKDGARFKIQDSIPLTFYANGIVLFNGPFRPLSDSETQVFLKDIHDGYFPSELQNRYPDGVPFKVTDLRKVYFDNKRRNELFAGSGQTLGGETKPSRLVPSNLERAPTKHKERSFDTSSSYTSTSVSSHLPGRQLTVEEFLNKLPSTVVKQGKIINIRDSLGDHLQQEKDSKQEVVVVETSVTSDIKKRLETEKSTPPSSSRDVTTLRIKSESGDQTYIVKMRFRDTVGNLRHCLDKQRRGLPTNYQIISAYPHKTFDDKTLTLEECGLTPNAVLHLQPVKRS